MSSRWGRMLSSRGETLITGGAVVVCFAAFLFVVRLIFPEGVSLRAMTTDGALSPWETSVQAAETPALQASGVGGRAAQVATLTRVVRRVKDKPSDSITWQDAQAGAMLGDRHAVQTQAGSQATITLGDRETIVLGENSLVVLKSFDAEPDGSDREATLLVLGGEVRAELGGTRAPVRLRVQTPRGEASVERSADSKEASALRVSVGADSVAEISVLRGTATVSMGSETIRVGAQDVVDVGSGSAPRVRTTLPDPPGLVSPAPDARMAFRARPVVDLSWHAVASATGYRVVVSRDRTLVGPEVSREIGGTSLSVPGLADGTWWWSVAVRKGNVESPMAKPRRFVVKLDDVAPPLDLFWPTGDSALSGFALRGMTEPGARVFVGQHSVEAGPDGRFEIPIPLARGANQVVVEAVDAAGNSTYASRIVTAKE